MFYGRFKEVKLTKDFVSYGYYRLNVEFGNGDVITAITGNTELVSDIDSEIDVIREQAIMEAVKFVKANGETIRN